MADAPELKRGLFGYRKDDVQTLLSDRERMFLEASEEARTTEHRLDATRAELEAARTEADALRETLQGRVEALEEANRRLSQLETDLAAATSQVAEHSQRAREAEQRLEARQTSLLERVATLEAELEEARATPAGVGELSAVLDATRDAIERIMAGARRSAEDQLAEVHRTREELESEIERASAWREHVSPLVEAVRREIGRTQAQVVQVGARVSEALRPMTDALSTLGTNLENLDRAAATEEPAETTEADRVDLVSHERHDDDAQVGEALGGPESGPPAPATHETPAWRGGEGWR